MPLHGVVSLLTWALSISMAGPPLELRGDVLWPDVSNADRASAEMYPEPNASHPVTGVTWQSSIEKLGQGS